MKPPASTTMARPSDGRPCHTSGGGTAATAAGNYWANDGVTRGKQLYASNGGSAMNPAVFPPAPPSQPHDNMPPYLVLNFIIALNGIFPQRS